MQLQPHPFSIPFVMAALISAGFAATIWRHRFAPGAISLFIHMLGLVIWSGGNAAMWLSTTLHAQLFWLNISWLGMLVVPATFFVFSLQVSHNERLVSPKLILLLSIEPLVGMALVWTNDFHHLVFDPPQLWVTDSLAHLQISCAIFPWVDIVYSSILIVVGIWFLTRTLGDGGSLLRAQTQTVLKGAYLSLAANLVYLIPGLSAAIGLNVAPFVFTLTGTIYFFAITRQKLLELIPVAHSILINSMTDGVMVLDLQDRILEMNPAAGKFLNVTPTQMVGLRAKDVLASWKETTKPFWDQTEIRTEVNVAQDIPRYIDLNITPLVDARQHSFGRILVFRDISSRKQGESILKDSNKQLHEQLDEIRLLHEQLHEQATRDPLTNLYNRRYLEDMLSQELARANREGYPVCAIMIDIDRFKRVNDNCGHKAGDEVLQSLAALIVGHIRHFDAACRFGGEEFVIVMPNLSIETARERADFLRREFENIALPCSDLESGPTLSIGVASYPVDGANSEQLLNAADQALYAAKGSGRNRVMVYSELTEKRELSDSKTSQ
jgi:diguanylate cyclase (GGDEF)-like protein